MDIIIHFFRDVLDGPLYVIDVVICSILICSCIGYLGEGYLLKKNKEKNIITNNKNNSQLENNNVKNNDNKTEVLDDNSNEKNISKKPEKNIKVISQDTINSAEKGDISKSPSEVTLKANDVYGIGVSTSSDDLLDDD